MADISKIKVLDGTTYDIKDTNAVAKAGDTMTGDLNFNNKGILWQYPANGNYTTKLSLNGYNGTSGSYVPKLGFDKKTIIKNVSEPETATDAANKSYVDGAISSAISSISYPVTSVNGQTGAVNLAIPSTAADIGAYALPSTGIPKTDLAAAVQTSLEKADTALQTFTETDPTVPAWAKAVNPPTEIFWCEYDVTSYLEIDDAVTNGMLPALKEGGAIYLCSGKTNGVYEFCWFEELPSSNLEPSTLSIWKYGCDEYGWSMRYIDTPTVYSPHFSGTPEAPTAVSGTNNKQIATTAFVQAALPTKVSDLTNDSGFIATESDPTVPSWAKAASKPSYTASEVGALPANTFIPADTSDLTNGAGFITINDVPTEIFWCTYNTTGYTEITTALNSGKMPCVSLGGIIYVLTYCDAYQCNFASVWNKSSYYLTCTTGNTWGSHYVALYSKPSGGIPASDLASGVIPTVPTSYNYSPEPLGDAYAGTATEWARGDHVHDMPTASDVGAIALPSFAEHGDILANIQGEWVAYPLIFPVTSVNNRTGAVTLSASDVGALPSTTVVPAASSAIPQNPGVAAAGSATDYSRADHVHNLQQVVHVGTSAPSDSDIRFWLDTDEPGASGVTSVNNKNGTVTLDASDIGLGNVDNVQQYSATNPPPYPVTSVNNKTGAVTLNAWDVGGLSMDLLWTNPNPTSNFAAQTVSIDLSGYDAVRITFIANMNSPVCYIQEADIDNYEHKLFALSATPARQARTFVFSSAGIIFENGATGETAGSQYCVPIKIRGIKF